MTKRPRFTLILTVQDGHGFEPAYSMAIGCDKALRISTRAVEELKMAADIGMSTMSAEDAITMVRTKVMRRKLLIEAATRLAGQLADRMEDAEGWHDETRIEPARKQLGGRWSD